jgi:hypothetical protein
MIRQTLSICVTSVLTLAALGNDQARAANPLELKFWLSGPRYDGVLPPCDHPAALDQITFRFHQKEDRFWNSELVIVAFDGGVVPYMLDGVQYIAVTGGMANPPMQIDSGPAWVAIFRLPDRSNR